MFNQLPAELQAIVQDKTLERTLQDSLKANLAFRSIADRESFPAGIGETLTKTRKGLRATAKTPLPNVPSSDLTGGMTPSSTNVEQYTLSVAQYGDQAETNLVTERVAIASKFLIDAEALGEQAARTIDELARDKLYSEYDNGNSSVKTTLGSAGDTITVLDIDGFEDGQAIKVGANVYTAMTVTPTTGTEGTIKFTASVSVANGTAGQAVVAESAGLVLRPNDKATTAALAPTDLLNAKVILKAKSVMEANGVKGPYVLYTDPIAAMGLYSDPMFQAFFQGSNASDEWKDGVVAKLLGVTIVRTNMAVIAGSVHKAILCGQGALIEGVFTNSGYERAVDLANANISFHNGVAHIVRGPLDARAQWATQSWVYIGGFAVPRDALSNSLVIPTSNGRALKRAIVIESM